MEAHFEIEQSLNLLTFINCSNNYNRQHWYASSCGANNQLPVHSTPDSIFAVMYIKIWGVLCLHFGNLGVSRR